MATIKRFEERKAWQEAKELAKAVYVVTRAGTVAKDLGLKDQIQCAAVARSKNAEDCVCEASAYKATATLAIPNFATLPIS